MQEPLPETRSDSLSHHMGLVIMLLVPMRCYANPALQDYGFSQLPEPEPF